MRINLGGLKEPARNVALGIAMGAGGGLIGDQNGRMNSAQFAVPAQEAQGCVYSLNMTNVGDKLPLDCRKLSFSLKAVTSDSGIVVSPVLAKAQTQALANDNHEKAKDAYKSEVKWAMDGFLVVWGLVTIAATLATIDNEEKALKGLR